MINLDHDIGRLMITYLELQKKISSCGIKWDVARGYVQQQIETRNMQMQMKIPIIHSFKQQVSIPKTKKERGEREQS